MKVPIVKYPSNILTTPARVITSDELKDMKVNGTSLSEFVSDMTDATLAHKGLGLTAPQVGWGLRVIVFKAAKGVTHLLNPAITKTSTQRLPDAEGCLSLPGFKAYVMRYRSITVTGYTLAGEPVLFKAEHEEARVLQHEIDHLDGILITSRVGALDRERAEAFLYAMANPVIDPLVAAGRA